METIGTKANIIVPGDAEELAAKALEIFAASAQEAMAEKEKFFVAISGGHTPRPFFELLGREPSASTVPWRQTELFWVDEHCVPPQSQWSNYKIAADTFLSQVGIWPQSVHRIPAELSDSKMAARSYEETIRQVFGLEAGQLPSFDMIVLGMGADAHTGSLFRDSYAVFDKDDLACVVYFMDGKRNRITLTHPVLCAAKKVLILISGGEKAKAVKDVLTSDRDEVQYPIHTIWPIMDRVTWLIDKDAARLLQGPG